MLVWQSCRKSMALVAQPSELRFFATKRSKINRALREYRRSRVVNESTFNRPAGKAATLTAAVIESFFQKTNSNLDENSTYYDKKQEYALAEGIKTMKEISKE